MTTPLEYSCLENPMDRGAWWAIDHRVTKSQIRLKQLGMHACGSQSVVPRPAISTSLRSFLAIMILGGPKTYQTERVGPRCLFPEAL